MMRAIGFVGWSGAGKTTLLSRLIPVLVAQGCSVSTVKHAHHGFDLDRPGKDSHAHRVAGASEVLVASGERWALLHELRDQLPPTLAQLLGRLSPVDLVLIEGFKMERLPKIEVFRASMARALLQPEDSEVIAVASDDALVLPVPVWRLADLAGLAAFVRTRAEPI